MSVAVLVPTRFQWVFGGQSVHLCGSFTRWVETVPMLPVEGQPGKFQVIVHLPPGYHQYKFIVDGEWRHDESQPFMPDPLGNVNNWLFVRRSNDPQQNSQQPPPPQVLLSNTGAASGQLPAPSSLVGTSGGPHAQPLGPLTPTHSLGHGLPSQHLADTASSSDVDMTIADASTPLREAPEPQPLSEPELTRRRIKDFLHSHTAYELIPESGKVVLLDVDLPIRQAFHALYDQNIASAPLYDEVANNIVGMISASDFIHILRRLHSNVSSGHKQLTEAEMDVYTLRQLRQGEDLDVCPPRQLVYLHTDDPLSHAVATMFESRSSMAPILTVTDKEGVLLLAVATISGVLASLMRNFRTITVQLPLLMSPIRDIPLGTWAETSTIVQKERAAGIVQGGIGERRSTRKVRMLTCVQLEESLMTALDLILEHNISALPVVDSAGVLQNMYARTDITQLAKSNAYLRLQWEQLTVGQTLSLLSVQADDGGGPAGSQPPSPSASVPVPRCHTTHVDETLRTVVERLSQPGVRRLFVIERDTRRLEGIISLSDVAAFLCDVPPSDHALH